MKKLVLVPLAALALATTARAEGAAAAKAAPAAAAPAAPAAAAANDPVTVSRTGSGQATSYRTVSVRAKVVAVDQEKRTITLAGKDGKTEKFSVGPQVKRLAEIAPGDYIDIKYEQGLLLQVADKGDGAAQPSGTVELQRAGGDKAPAGSAYAQVRGQVTVKSVNQKNRTVVLETQKGELLKVTADKSIDLAKVKPGLKLDGVYSESVAVSVEKAPAKAAPAKAPAAADKPAAK
jgi:hypothetical protein